MKCGHKQHTLRYQQSDVDLATQQSETKTRVVMETTFTVNDTSLFFNVRKLMTLTLLVLCSQTSLTRMNCNNVQF